MYKFSFQNLELLQIRCGNDNERVEKFLDHVFALCAAKRKEARMNGLKKN